jgi:hypothetical protein
MLPRTLALPRYSALLQPLYAAGPSLSVLATKRRMAGSVCTGLVALCLLRAGGPQGTAQGPDLKVRVASSGLQGAFEANRGQADESVQFLARSEGFALLLTSEDMVVALPRSRERLTEAGIRIHLPGASAARRLLGEDPLPQDAVYRLGALAESAFAAPAYGRVVYDGLYPGIHLRLRETGAALVLSFDVERGANPDAIRLGFSGARLEGLAEKDVRLRSETALLRVYDLVAYQGRSLTRRMVPVKFVRRSDALGIAVELGRYDVRERLVIESCLRREQHPTHALVSTVAQNGLGRGQ